MIPFTLGEVTVSSSVRETRASNVEPPSKVVMIEFPPTTTQWLVEEHETPAPGMQQGLAAPGVQSAPFASVHVLVVEQVPPTHASAPQLVPHAPQFAGSFATFVHVPVPAQYVSVELAHPQAPF